MWIVFCVIVVLLLIALLAVIPTIKDNMRRPRYRIVSGYDVEYKAWWQPTHDYLEIMSNKGIPMDETDHFKSFPSGHTAEVSILFVVTTFFPLADKRFEKYQLPAFLCASGMVLFVALARIMAAAHYLSDVSWGAFVILTLLFIANEVVSRIKGLHIKEEKVEDPKAEEQKSE